MEQRTAVTSVLPRRCPLCHMVTSKPDLRCGYICTGREPTPSATPAIMLSLSTVFHYTPNTLLFYFLLPSKEIPLKAHNAECHNFSFLNFNNQILHTRRTTFINWHYDSTTGVITSGIISYTLWIPTAAAAVLPPLCACFLHSFFHSTIFRHWKCIFKRQTTWTLLSREYELRS